MYILCYITIISEQHRKSQFQATSKQNIFFPGELTYLLYSCIWHSVCELPNACCGLVGPSVYQSETTEILLSIHSTMQTYLQQLKLHTRRIPVTSFKKCPLKRIKHFIFTGDWALHSGSTYYLPCLLSWVGL